MSAARQIDVALRGTVVDEGARIVLYGEELGEGVILDVLFESDDYASAFLESFEIAGVYLADEDRYQGLNLTRLIRRKTDGALFGFTYWEDISKHGESSVEPNGEEHGIEWEYPPGFDWDDWFGAYVFLPVESFTITGYRTIEPQEGESRG